MYVNKNNETGLFVTVREMETFESLIKRFKKKVVKSEVLKEYKDRCEYIKPSDLKRKKKKMARNLILKESLKQEKEIQKRKKKKGIKP